MVSSSSTPTDPARKHTPLELRLGHQRLQSPCCNIHTSMHALERCRTDKNGQQRTHVRLSGSHQIRPDHHVIPDGRAH